VLPAIAGADVGNRIYDAIDFYTKLTTGGTTNYSLAKDIDLEEYRDPDGNPRTGGWLGPSDYRGTLFGNGYTIKNLILKTTDIRAGLFHSLAGEACLKNFTIEVSTEDENSTPNEIYFGGVAADVNSTTGNGVLIEDVTVKGTLVVGSINRFVNIGGIVAVVTSSKLTFRRCAVDLDVKLKGAALADSRYRSFGGLVATCGGTLDIEDCRYTGTIDVKNSTDSMTRIGGLVGSTWRADPPVITISNSYASGRIIADIGDRVDCTDPTQNDNRYVCIGGLIGYGRPTSSLSITNSASLMNEIIVKADTGSVFQEIYLGRLVGLWDSSATFTPTNNIVSGAMQIGKKIGTVLTLDSGFTDDRDSTDGKLVTANANGLYKKQTWTAAAPTGLGWSTDVWDCDNLSATKLPQLLKEE
jgi:hypothetical protein